MHAPPITQVRALPGSFSEAISRAYINYGLLLAYKDHFDPSMKGDNNISSWRLMRADHNDREAAVVRRCYPPGWGGQGPQVGPEPHMDGR